MKDLPELILIGASPGGLEPLIEIVASLPKNPKATFVIAQHLSPNSETMLVDILSRKSQNRIFLAAHNQELRHGEVLIVPPGMNARICRDRIELMLVVERTHATPNIDLLFESALDQAVRTAVVILSGSGRDGCIGLRLLAQAGARAMVQVPTSAKFPSMPQASLSAYADAIQFLPKDFWQVLESGEQPTSISSPHEIEKFRYSILAEADDDETAVSKDQELDSETKSLFDLVRHQSGINFHCYKIPSIKRRLKKHCDSKGIANILQLFDAIEHQPGEAHALARDLLIPVTHFFRDTEVWDRVAEHIEHKIKQAQPYSELRAWVAACSSGEEAYTLAMIFKEKIVSLGSTVTFKIFATDAVSEQIEKARRGVYDSDKVEGIPKHLLERYFESSGSKLEVSKSLRDHIVFSVHELIESPPFFRIDIVTCRNVLIYLRPVFQDYVVAKLVQSLNKGGLLVLGRSESLRFNGKEIDILDVRNKIYRRVNDIANMQTRANMSSGFYNKLLSEALPQRIQAIQSHRQQSSNLSDRVLNFLCPPTAVVDEEWNVLHLIGDLNPFMVFKPGPANQKITAVVKDEFQTECILLLNRLRNEAKSHMLALP